MTSFESHSRFRTNTNRSEQAMKAEEDVNRVLFQPLGTSGLNLQRLLTNGLTDLCRTKHTGVQALRTLADLLDSHNPLKLVYEAPPEGSSVPIALPQSGIFAVGETVQADAIPVRSLPRSNSPRVTYLVGGSMAGILDIAKLMADKLGYTIIDVNELLRHKGGENGVVEASVVCPLVIDKLLTHPNATDFVIVGAPRSVKELHFIEYNFPCESRMVYLKYSRNDLLHLALNFGRSERRAIEESVSSIFSADQGAVFKSFGDRLFCLDLEISSTEADFESVVSKTWKKVGEIVKPEISIVCGYPGSGLTTLANRLASTHPGNFFSGDLSINELIGAAQSSPHFRIVVEAKIPINWDVEERFRIREWIQLVPKDSIAEDAARSRSSRSDDFKFPEFQNPKVRVIEFSAETTTDEIFNLVMQGRRPQTIVVTGVPFSGVKEHSQLIGTKSGYPVGAWQDGDTVPSVFDRCNASKSPVVIVEGVPPASVDELKPFALILFTAEKEPLEERTAKAAAWHAEREIEFNAEAFAASSNEINSALLEISSPAVAIKDSVDTWFLLPKVYLVEDLEISNPNFQVLHGVKPEELADALKAAAKENKLEVTFIVKNCLSQLKPNIFPAVRDVLDSLNGLCNFQGIAFAERNWVAEAVEALGFKLKTAEEIV